MRAGGPLDDLFGYPSCPKISRRRASGPRSGSNVGSTYSQNNPRPFLVTSTSSGSVDTTKPLCQCPPWFRMRTFCPSSIDIGFCSPAAISIWCKFDLCSKAIRLITYQKFYSTVPPDSRRRNLFSDLRRCFDCWGMGYYRRSVGARTY